MIEEKKNNKLLVIILLVLGSIAILVGICLLAFGKTDEKPKNDDNIEENNAMVYENTTDTKLMVYEINETNKEFKLNGKSILLKKIEEVLYINNEEISSLKFGVDNIYLRKDYMIVEGGGQDTGYPYIINENGKIIEIAGGVLDNPNNSIEELHLENGKLVATKHADTDIKVEIVYDGVSASIKEASTSTTDNSPVIKTGKEELETENKKFEIGGKIYTLKYIEDGDKGAIYLNDKKVASIDGYVHIEASFIGKYLFIEWPGAQGGPFAWGYFDQNAKYYDISNNDPLIYKVSYEKGKMYCYIEDKQAQVEMYETKKVELTLNGNKATVKDINIVGKYVNDKFDGDYIELFADGTASAPIIFSGEHDENAKSFFTKDELTYKLTYGDDIVYLELIPNESLDAVYKQWFGEDGQYYYVGKLVNGVYQFESVNGSPVATPGENKYIKK